MSIRVLLVDDHMILRQGLRALLDDTANISVIADAENGAQALQLTRELHPDLVVVDISLPDISGMELARLIKAEFPEILILALSMHSDKRYVFEMLNSGANGFLLKDCAAEDLAIAIRTVKSGKIYLSPSIADTIVKGNIRSEQAGTENSCPITKLTLREKGILQFIAEGKSTKEIAFHFGLSIKTVETHRQHIMNKLQLFNIADLTKFAIREGLASLS